MINTVADFTGDYNLTQLSLEEPDLQEVINEEEIRVLTDIMGGHEFRLLEEDLDVDGIPQTQKYIDLIEGSKEYTVKDVDGVEHTLEWGGLKETLKGYCYFAVLHYQKSFNTGSGEVQLLGSETDRPSTGKAKTARNKAARLTGKDLREYTCDKSLGIVSINSQPYDAKNYNWYWEYAIENTFFNYMLANISDFPKWTFKQQDIIVF